MNIRTALAALVISALSAAAADVDAKKTTVPLTTADLLRLVSTANKVEALFKDARRRRSSSSRHRGSLADQGGDNASGGEGGLRFLAGGEGGDSCEDKLDECRADLGLCQSETDGDGDGASFLYVQMAQTCKIKEKTDGKGKVYYELSSKDMDDDTYALTDRPFRAAEAMSTRQFFKDFDATFSEETGGRPNTAVTFRHRDTGNFEGPLISVFVEAAYRKDSGKYVYELTQSEEQEEVSALKDFFRKGDGRDDGIVEYEMCSLFIDSSDDGCSPEVGSGGVDERSLSSEGARCLTTVPNGRVPVGALVPLVDGAAGLKSRDSSVLGQQIGEQPGSREVLPDQQAFDGATVFCIC